MAGKKFKPESHKRMRRTNKPTLERSLEIIYWLHDQRSSTKWKKLRKLVRQCHPMCCGEGCTKPATSVHHVRSAAKFPELFYNMDNLSPLCWNCHADVSEMERNGHFVEAEQLYSEKAQQISNKYMNSLV